MSSSQSRAYYRAQERRMGRNPDDPHGMSYINQELAKHPPRPPHPDQEQRQRQADLEEKLANAHAAHKHPDHDYEDCPYCRSWRFDAAVTFVQALQSYFAPASEERIRRYFR